MFNIKRLRNYVIPDKLMSLDSLPLAYSLNTKTTFAWPYKFL